MSDRYASMTWPFAGPCPTCGLTADGVPVFRPTDGVALPDDVVQRQLAFADTRPPDGGTGK